ncbi:COG complex component [Pluteus cervinus]|uniref:COG complex component n=1 Tax=Pluteus cervinus TaxID=181527 RepID=A0ACD3BCM0_9AGAR|nr:COG complex component [Pluteus cervinus]
MAAALRSPPASATFRDPYELERLAEELVSREQGKEDPTLHDFPLYIPLAHHNPHLTAEEFNVEEFLLSRSYTSLSDLRKELRDYLADLKEELVQLINDDYEAFISLSTDLQGEGTRLTRIKAPLSILKEHIMRSKKELLLIQDAIQDKLKKRTKLREEKALLHLLLKISDAVTRLETLLLITAPGTAQTELQLPSQYTTGEDARDDKLPNNRAKHLGRVASEYTQLLYHAEKARNENCKYVDEMQWRIDRIQSTLSSDLDHLFATTLNALSDRKKESPASDVEKTRWIADITECLRSYDALHLWRDAEDVIRREVVRGFVKKTIHPSALIAPHSPIMPHTPFHTIPDMSLLSSTLPPRTPYTPFTAFSLKQPDPTYSTSSSSPYAHILSNEDDPLARLYNQILRFIERDLCRIMKIAEKVSVDPTSTARVDKPARSPPVSASHDAVDPSADGFQIMANVIWEEIGRAIMDELGGIVFATGRPNEFRKNYELSQAFIRSLEYLSPSLRAVEAMRAHPLYAGFERRWQLPVYFQLRWKEIVGKLEDSLGSRKLDTLHIKGKNSYATSQAMAVWIAITGCWSSEVFIPELANKFWRLTLQILSRYRTWISDCSVELQLGITSTGFDDKSTPPRIPSNFSTEPASADLLSAEDRTLRYCTAIVLDIQALENNVLTLWREEVSIMLPETQFSGDRTQSEDALRHAFSQLTSIISPLSHEIVNVLARRCCEGLLPMRSIPTQFRAMSNKRPPTEPSYFVTSILRPLRTYFGIGSTEAVGSALKVDFLASFATQVFDSVVEQYTSFVTVMKKSEESLRRLKKGKKSGFSLFGAAGGRDDDGDEERIRIQMVFDVLAFGQDAASLGIELSKHKSFQNLQEIVQSADSVDPS